MKEQIFITLVKRQNEDNAFIRGSVSEMLLKLCGGTCYARLTANEGLILRVQCCPSAYSEFTKQIEIMFPGACIFNYEV